MADVLTPEKRHRCMSNIRSKNSKPEMIVRGLVHGMGYRYRLHKRDLPGKPDLVFSKKRKVIFVHGCFWHKHDCPQGNSNPKTNAEFWYSKRQSNQERDRKNIEDLKQLGWEVLVIWECSIKNQKELKNQLDSFLCE